MTDIFVVLDLDKVYFLEIDSAPDENNKHDDWELEVIKAIFKQPSEFI